MVKEGNDTKSIKRKKERMKESKREKKRKNG